jgi:hypothetical protein
VSALRLFWVVLAVTLAGGCMRRGPGTAGETAPGRFGALEAPLAASRWLAPDSARARAAGAGESVVVAVEAGAAGDRVSGMLALPENECGLLIARASPSVEDVDLFAYGDDGSVLGADEAPDKTPALIVCPPHPARIYLSARIAAGHGLVALGAQRVAPGQAVRVARATGARGLVDDPKQRLEAWPGLDDRLAEHRRMIGAKWQDLRRVAVPIDARMPTSVSAAIDDRGCVDVLVIPSDEVSHLDVAAVDLEGRIIGRAAAVGRDRALIVCAPSRAALTVEIRPHAGRGLAAVVISRLTEGEHDLDAQALRYDLAPTGDLATAREKNAARLEHYGYDRVKAKVIGEGALEVGRRASVAVDLPNGCARLDVLSGAPVRGIEAWLWSADGSLLASERGSGQVTLFACGRGGKVRLDTEALTRPGRYAVELRREGDTPKLLDEHPLAAARLLGRMSSRGVIRSASQVGAARVVELSPARFETVDLLVPIGRCVDLTLALGPGATGAEIRMVDTADGKELGLTRGTYSAGARACALDRTGTLNARAELRAGAGQTRALTATRMLSPKD